MVSPELDAGIGTWLEFVCPLLMVNHEVTLLTSSNAIRKIKCHNTIKLDSWNFPPKYYYMPRLKSLIKNSFFKKFDIIQIHGIGSFAADYLMLKKNKIKTPIIFSPHGGLQPHPNLSFMRIIHDKIFLTFDWNKFDMFTAISFAEKERLCELGFDEKKIDVVYNGGGNSKKSLNKKISDKKTILYIGRLSRPKNVDLLIEAFSLCELDDVKLIIAGPDFGAFEYLKQKTKELGLEKNVIFKGRVSDEEKYQLLSEATVFVHPSLTDVFAITLIEAAQMGIPCIAFNVGANSEIIENGITGILTENPTSGSLSKTIMNILFDDDLVTKISENARNITPRKFNWENTVDSLEQVYQKTLTKI